MRAANLIRTFGSEALKAAFLPAMYSGSWQGTMALTEPDAGSSLSDISTMAVPGQSQGSYFIQGQKIFISAGDHDAAENIIHLMLAKIKGGPAGAKGISLFVVPKYRVNEAGQLIHNDVQTSGLYHKMGYKGAPIVHLTLGENTDCMGYLVGEPHKGLSYMFQMMNEARLGVGMNATAIASAAFEASKAYALERKQGRKIGEKDPAKPQTAIINHADVRRMLLFQKAVVEGSLSLLLYCSKLADISHASTNTTEKEEAALLLDLLTPIAKSYPSEMGVLSCSAAIQVLGGAGYTTDFPLEQYYREARIHPIHEGTTGIHGLDLLGRKLGQHQGRGLAILLSKIQAGLAAINTDNLLPAKQQFLQYLDIASKATEHLLKIAAEDPERFLADASLFLELYGHIVIAWQWLQMAQVAEKTHESADFSQDFLKGKTSCCEYYIAYELPKVAYLAGRLQSSSYPTLHCKPEWI